MRVQQHFNAVFGGLAAGAGIVAGQRQCTSEHVHRHEYRQNRRHPRADVGADFFHELFHQRIAQPHPRHSRNAPEKAVQQVDASAQIELELTVVPEYRAEQKLGDGAAEVFVSAVHNGAEHEQIAVALVFVLPQQHGSHDQRQTPYHAERPPHQTGPAHPDARRHTAEDGLGHVAEERPDDEQPQQVGKAERLFHRHAALGLRCRRVGVLDALFDVDRDAPAQGVRMFAQTLVQLFQHRVLGGIAVHQHSRADLIQRRHCQRHPHRRAQQP